MARSSPVLLRIPLLALAVGDLVLLAVRLRPWNAVASLPGQGSTGYDPAICLLTYLGVMVWLSGNQNPWLRQVLAAGTLLGLPAGLLVVAHLLLRPRPETAFVALHVGLLLGAGVLWAVAGHRGARAADHFAMGIVSGIWSAMVSSLMACATILATMNPASGSTAATPAAWSQNGSPALGASATAPFVHALVTATGFLLICPLVGGALGLLSGLGQDAGR